MTISAGAIFLLELFNHLRSKESRATPLAEGINLDISKQTALSNTFYLFIGVIFLFTLIDLYVHGIIILGDRTRYSIFNEYEARIRHISMLIWIFAPLSLIKIFPTWTRIGMFFWSIIFPVLVLDRNRLLMALFSVAIVFFILNWTRVTPKAKKLIAASLALLCVGVFSLVGEIRSGSNGIVSTYTDSRTTQITLMGVKDVAAACKVPEYLPVSQHVRDLPQSLQWLILYAASPIYNLAMQDTCAISDPSFLKAQVIPLWKRFNSTGGPLLVSPRLNVGTEAMPFFLAFGALGVLVCIIAEYLILKLSAEALLRQKSLFSLLLFLRFSYCAVFFGFAPQFFLWTTLGFVLVILSAKRIFSFLQRNPDFLETLLSSFDAPKKS
ncbi:hypothetical protein [Bdellovibrio sp.]|uniref:hypothetical protein n=1 Tax=Bdellovibrio sp. TaxID=28201 RepID=UPI0039E4BDFE